MKCTSRRRLFLLCVILFYILIIGCDGGLDGFTNLGSSMFSKDVYESKKRDVFIEEYNISNKDVPFCDEKIQLFEAWKEYDWSYKNIFRQTLKSDRQRTYLSFKSINGIDFESLQENNYPYIHGLHGNEKGGVFYINFYDNCDSINLVFCDKQRVIITKKK